MQVITLSFFRFAGVSGKLWAFWQMLESRWAFGKLPGIGFHAQMGTGSREGFHPRPNLSVWAVLAVWDSLEDARAALNESRVYRRYKDHSAEHCSVYLEAVRARGQWAGVRPFAVGGDPIPTDCPSVAVLTRATIRPRNVVDFWRRVPDISSEIRAQDKLQFKVGLGEVPWLHQVTFTIWEDKAAMDAFAYRHFHGAAIQAVRDGGWFAEELFARFRVLDAEGVWEGRAPLARP